MLPGFSTFERQGAYHDWDCTDGRLFVLVCPTCFGNDVAMWWSSPLHDVVIQISVPASSTPFAPVPLTTVPHQPWVGYSTEGVKTFYSIYHDALSSISRYNTVCVNTVNVCTQGTISEICFNSHEISILSHLWLGPSYHPSLRSGDMRPRCTFLTNHRVITRTYGMLFVCNLAQWVTYRAFLCSLKSWWRVSWHWLENCMFWAVTIVIG